MVQGQVDERLLRCLEVNRCEGGHGVPPDHATDFAARIYEQYALLASLFTSSHTSMPCSFSSPSLSTYIRAVAALTPQASPPSVEGGSFIVWPPSSLLDVPGSINVACTTSCLVGVANPLRSGGFGRPEAVWFMRLVRESMLKMAGDKM